MHRGDETPPGVAARLSIMSEALLPFQESVNLFAPIINVKPELAPAFNSRSIYSIGDCGAISDSVSPGGVIAVVIILYRLGYNDQLCRGGF